MQFTLSRDTSPSGQLCLRQKKTLQQEHSVCPLNSSAYPRPGQVRVNGTRWGQRGRASMKSSQVRAPQDRSPETPESRFMLRQASGATRPRLPHPEVGGGARCPPRGLQKGPALWLASPPVRPPLLLSRVLPIRAGGIFLLTTELGVSVCLKLSQSTKLLVYLLRYAPRELASQAQSRHAESALTEYRTVQKPVRSPKFLPQTGKPRRLQCGLKSLRRFGAVCSSFL